ncbi:MAG: protein kinase domain-containing protein [Planctomycetota bacterium]|jgi:tetratricopeptide (TPR) repeat protein/tRNA A-37 threonylcarbamoyl transferase component Bud32
MSDEDRAKSDRTSPTLELPPPGADETGGRPAASEPMPDRIGQYRVRRIIASGGMGTVYEAMQEQPRRRVALKVMKAGIASKSALRRFEYESQILARLRHPGIAQVFEAGTHDDGGGGVPYFAMEYIPNARPITEYAVDSLLSTRQRLKLIVEVCDAVHHGHQKGIIHRDLKPANILVDSSGRPRIIDFGVARATDSDLAVTTLQTDIGQLIGTLQYMSPEQCDADPEGLDIRSDIYALGVVLYELLCGAPPYDITRVSVLEMARVIREEVPARPSTMDRMLRGDVETIALKALEKDRSRRYQSAADLGQDIERYLNDEPIQARPPSATYLVRKLVARNRALVLAVLGVPILAVLILATIVSSLFAVQSRQRLLEREAERDRVERMLSQARGVANTFMYDLHDRIRDLDGSLPARELLVTTALEYLDGLAREAPGNPDLLREVAAAYERVGDIRGGIRNASLGNTAGALESYQAALTLRLQLVAAAPDDQGLRYELASSHIRIGDMLERTGDANGALEAYQKALEVRERLVEADARHRNGLPIALNEVGTALIRLGRLSEARTYYDRAVTIGEQLAAEQPDDPRLQRDLSVAQIRVAELLFETGDDQTALARFEDAIGIRTALLESNPGSGQARRDLAVARYLAGQVLLELARPEQAIEHLSHFLAVAEQRAGANPFSARAQRDLAVAHESVGRAHVMTGDFDRAQEELDHFQRMITVLTDFDPVNTHLRQLLASRHERLPSSVPYRRALRIIEPLSRADPDHTELTKDRAQLLLRLGSTLALSDDRDEAAQTLELARDLYQDLLSAEPETARLREDLAETQEALSQLPDSTGS